MSIKIITTDFFSHESQLKQIREIVFIKEQGVPVELEWDEFDANAIHLLAMQSNIQNFIPVGTGRMLDDGHIGRMAVLVKYRNQGIGSKLLVNFLLIAKERKLEKVFLSSQETAIDFYKKHGFMVASEVYMDAGIPHKDMELIF